MDEGSMSNMDEGSMSNMDEIFGVHDYGFGIL